MLEKFSVACGEWVGGLFDFSVSQSPKSIRTLVLDLDLTLDLDLGLSLDNIEILCFSGSKKCYRVFNNF